MRLALQALFGANDDRTDEGRRRRAQIERELRNNKRSVEFFRRLRAVVSDRNLKAPEIFAEESFPDANIVAEYLDCQSESDEIEQEYERVCFESPEILAEVGCSYDLLTNRLCQAYEAPKNCRRRLYYVAWEEESPSVSSSRTSDAVSNRAELYESPAKETSRRKTVSPDQEVQKTRREVVSQKRKNVPRTRSEPYETDVQKTVRRERSIRRRSRSWLANVFVLAAVLGAGYAGYTKWNDDSGSETFELATDEVVTSDGSAVDKFVNDWPETVAESSVEQGGKVPDEILEPSNIARFEQRSDFDFEAPNIELRENEVATSDEEVLKSQTLSGTTLIASLPEESRTIGRENLELENKQTTARRSNRGGLGSHMMELRQSIEIPDRNNDVFSNGNFSVY